MASILKRHLLREFDHYFNGKGFTRSSDPFYGDRYDRAISGGRQSIAIASHIRKPALVLDPAFASIRLDEVEDEVFRFEQKNELINEHDVLQRATIGTRLDKHELFKSVTGKYAITTVDDCPRLGVQYASEMLSMAERFWQSFPDHEAILAKLANVPGEARKYGGTDFFAGSRAVVLTRMLHGDAEARRFAEGVLDRLSGEPKLELSRWAIRFFDARIAV
ncbi:hypothetical protein [Occallatibacter riparius]|uniref:Uncharacterized protein n=1 Tax=Occallatibacter riparius TaxID=1002689 RepID=A0A9J7BNF0_9BACT|nr:hypothetical protein [Occallatibacter riparius]UWZ84248.1 hypothetical protein MOP44_27340 [Occallatibacter riparius]